MSMNFNDVLDTKVEAAERPPLMPVGTYEWLIYKVPSMDTVGDGAWDTVDIPLKCIHATDDVDQDALASFGGAVAGVFQTLRFMFDKNDQHNFDETKFRLRRFLEEHVQVEKGLTFKESLNAAVNKRVLAGIVWKQDKRDPELYHANIGKTAPIDAEQIGRLNWAADRRARALGPAVFAGRRGLFSRRFHMYLIFSLPMQGWLTKTATYSSDTEDAKRFTRDEAIAACRAHIDLRARGFGWLPVYEKDLDAIKERKK